MERGLLGLYGGCAINLLLITPEKAIKLVVNDKMRTRLTDKDGNLSVQKQIIAGATAGACQCIITSPMEMFKIAGQTGVPDKLTFPTDGGQARHKSVLSCVVARPPVRVQSPP